jgi:MFS transporter, PAT family, beta-lactamase induction signal transducer AmpG
MRFPDLLASRRGRLAAFFLMYITEGIPLGFAAVTIATQMRRQGLSAAAIGAFTAAIYLPWAFKWAVGPIVDVFSSDRFGRRRIWIIATQLGMVASLFVMQSVGLSAGIATLTTLIIIHNIFAATQDVAIDALAVSTLHEDERGMAGGLTFAGAYLGQIVGGACALFLVKYIGFSNTYFFVAGAILCVTIFVVLPLREPVTQRVAAAGSGLTRMGAELGLFVRQVWGAFTESRASMVGLAFALLPAGAMALGLALAQTLAVDLGFDDDQVASLSLWTTICQSAGCIIGGWLSDRLGRRRALAWFILAMTPVTLWLAWTLWHVGWIHPVDPAHRAGVVVPALAVTVFWISSLIYCLANGMMYGARAALYMDVSDPRVAATQFTAYMALLNLGIAYSARWQGWAVDRYGYPVTLLADAFIGLVCLAFLAAMGEIRGTSRQSPRRETNAGPGRQNA